MGRNSGRANRNSESSKWAVLTGGPSVGKTTQTSYFAERGVSVLSESARVIYNTMRQSGLRNAQIFADNKSLFNQGVFFHQLARENHLDPDQVTILDRALPDSLAYIGTISGLDTRSYRSIIESRPRYGHIFLLDPVPFTKDDSRTENPKQRQIVQQALLDAYLSLDYEVTVIPFATVEERAAMIAAVLGLTLPAEPVSGGGVETGVGVEVEAKVGTEGETAAEQPIPVTKQTGTFKMPSLRDFLIR